MFRNVFTKTVRDQRRGLIGWSVGIFLLVFAMVSFWPSMKDIPNLEAFMSSYPDAMRKLFDLDAFATPTGYLNIEVFNSLVPILFVVFGIGRGARLIAGEEEAGTLETLLVTPITAIRILLEKAAALVVALLLLGLVLFAAVMFSSAVFGMGVPPADVITGSLAMTLLGLEFGALALALGAVTGRRSAAIGVATSLAVVSYVLYIAGQLVPEVDRWQQASPFQQAFEGGPVGAGLPLAYLWMLLAAVVAFVAALPYFDRRDIATH